MENFITNLHALITAVMVPTLKEELIHDRIVIVMADTKVSERLQLFEKLTLSEVITS